MLIDFRQSPPVPTPTLINGTAVEIVSQYKYLGTIIDNRLTFNDNTDYICNKANQRLFFLRKLRNFQVDRKLMKMFYSSFIESILTFALVAWFGNLSVANKNRLRSIVNMCRKIIGIDIDDLSQVFKTRAIKKARSIVWNPQHPLHAEFIPNKKTYSYPKKSPKGKKDTNRYHNSFVPSAVRFYNQAGIPVAKLMECLPEP